MLTDPDIELMMCFKAGDSNAFTRLFDKYKQRIVSYCARYCGDPQVAEELAQETFLRVYKAAPRYKPKARFSTWLYRIATNVCLNEIRKPHYSVRVESIDRPQENQPGPPRQIESEPAASLPDELLASRQHQARIHQAMGRLPEAQRAALLLRATEGFSYQEIGRQLNRSENHVKTLIYRARQRMKKLLGDD